MAHSGPKDPHLTEVTVLGTKKTDQMLADVQQDEQEIFLRLNEASFIPILPLWLLDCCSWG